MEHLIPEVWFVGQPQWLLLVLTAIAVLALGKGADWLVEAASDVARRLGMPKVIVGATIVSLGTTSPECAVSVMAAWNGQPGLALGNAIGSVIADTGLIFGIGCLITALPADRFVLSRQGWIQFGAGLLLAVLCYGAYFVMGDAASLGRWVGVLLLGLLVGYLWISVKWSRQHEGAIEVAEHQTRSAWLLATMGVAGLVLILLSSRAMILSVTELALVHWHVPEVVISATLVAFGTSLPELVIGLASVLKGHKEILVGNIIGADILNVLFVVGAAAFAAPLPLLAPGTRFPAVALVVHLPAMLAVLVLFRLFVVHANRRGEFSRWMGVPLLLLYVGYTVIQFVMAAG
jgi:cation:H+ antiporter